MLPTATIIRRLPAHVTDSVRSQHAIPDLPAAAAELVQNSLDAGARSIRVTANLAAWALIVEDDGAGIPGASLPLLGQRCCTSKPATGRGEALAALALVCQQVCVTTRAAGSFETHRKLLVGSTTGAAAGSSGSSSTVSTLCSVPRQRQGTTVVLSGFLHNEPVRRNALLQQQHGAGATAAACSALLPHAAACAALEQLKLALLVLMLPHTRVELVVLQQGSSSPVLHMAQDRSLAASIQALLQHSPALHVVKTLHQQGWQLDGAVLTAPAPTAGSSSSRLLYVNKAAVCCPVLASLLKDWFGRHVKAAQAAGGPAAAAGAVPGSSRHPEPSYVMLVTCPAAAVTITRLHGSCQLGAEFPSSSLAPLAQQLGAALGSVWGSMPPGWMAAVHRSGSGADAMACAASTRSASQGRRGAVCFSRGGGTAAGWLPHQHSMLPVHGLSINSKTRSLAGMQARPADTIAPATRAEHSWTLGDGGFCHRSHQLQQHQASELQATASELAALLADTDTEDDSREQLMPAACAATTSDEDAEVRLCQAGGGPSTKHGPDSPDWPADNGGWTAGWSGFGGPRAAPDAAAGAAATRDAATPGSPADMLLDSLLEPKRLQRSWTGRLLDMYSTEPMLIGDAVTAQHSMAWLSFAAGAADSPARAYNEAGGADCMASPSDLAWQQQGREPQLDWGLVLPVPSPAGEEWRLPHDDGEGQEERWQWWQQHQAPQQAEDEAVRQDAELVELLAAGCSPAPGSPAAAAHGHQRQARTIVTRADSGADAGCAFGFDQQPCDVGAGWDDDALAHQMQWQDSAFAASPPAAAAAALRPGFSSSPSRRAFGLGCGATDALQRLLASPPVAAAGVSGGGQAGGITGSCNSGCGGAGAGTGAHADDEAASGERGRSPATRCVGQRRQQQAPAINPAAGAMSEDTVQQEAGRRHGGRLQRHTREAGAEPQACSIQSTPPRLLQPFSERLLMSAPPAAKAVRQYARSDSVSNRALALADAAPARSSSSSQSRKRSDAAVDPSGAAAATAQASKRRRHTSPAVLATPAQQPDRTAAGGAGNDDTQSGKAPTAGASGGSSRKQYVQMRLPFQPLDPNRPQPAGPLKCSERAVVQPSGTGKAAASKGGRCVLKPAWVKSAAGGGSPEAATAGPDAATAAAAAREQPPAARAPAGRRVRFSGVDQVLGPDDGSSSGVLMPADGPEQTQDGNQGVAAAAAAASTEPARGAGSSRFFLAAAERRGRTPGSGCNPLTALLGGSAASGQLTASTPPAAAILSVDELCSNSRGGAASLLVPQAVSRQQLADGRALGQADSKLVVTRCGPVLLAVDQHAADERLQLEALQTRLAGEQQRRQHGPQQQPQQELLLQRRRLFPPHSVSLGMQEARALALYGEAVAAWGWQVVAAPGQHQPTAAAAAAAGLGSGISKGTLPTAAGRHQPGGGHHDGSGAAPMGAASTVLLQQVPVLAGVQLGAVDLQLYLHQLLETSGACSAHPPPGVLRVLRSKACRGAIMFGDALTARECEGLVARLATAQLPFMCAHGRPTTAPLVDLQQLASRLAQRSQLMGDCQGSSSQRHQPPLNVHLRRLLHRAT